MQRGKRKESRNDRKRCNFRQRKKKDEAIFNFDQLILKAYQDEDKSDHFSHHHYKSINTKIKMCTSLNF